MIANRTARHGSYWIGFTVSLRKARSVGQSAVCPGEAGSAESRNRSIEGQVDDLRAMLAAIALRNHSRRA